MATRIKEIGIIASYLWLLVLILLFNREPIVVFFAFYLEFIVLLVIYSVFRFIDLRKSPKKYYRYASLLTIISSTFPLLIFQYILIGLILKEGGGMEHDFFHPENRLLNTDVLIGLFAIFAFYLFSAIRMKDSAVRESTLRDTFLFQVLSLSMTNIVGLIVVFTFEKNQIIPVIALIVVRILLELIYIRKVRVE